MTCLLSRIRSARSRRATMGVLLCAALVWMAWPAELWAQAAQDSGPREMRHFWHVFIAFALAWVLIMGWIVSIVRRLRRIEDSLS